MFGISLSEFIVIIVVAMAIIPAKNWPSVFRGLARVVKFVREIIWKITDATESIRDQVEREIPMDKIISQTTDDVMGAFATPKKKARKK
ncbi:MAG: hypothetical protein LBL75_01870 [Rickettsiales bacterium]|jgi:Sec-independent protein translocase protein TatA|nr:hypothetical protein [Rickettsiales bacterium]